jgi:hypothetical protein
VAGPICSTVSRLNCTLTGLSFSKTNGSLVDIATN